MYLSQLLLNPYSRQVQRETADPYNLHRTLMRAFHLQRDQAAVLYRLEIHPRTGLPLLLVQSQAQPEWHRLPNPDYLLPADPFHPTPNPAVKPFHPTLHPGQIFRFRLVANPTIKKVRRDDHGERRHSNRVPLLDAEEQINWLAARGAQHGFRLLRADVSSPSRQKGWKPGAPPLTLYTVQFDGQLQVTDAAALLAALQTGIGPAKAFGCGLLSLAP